MKKIISIVLVVSLIVSVVMPVVSSDKPLIVTKNEMSILLDIKQMDEIVGGQTRYEPDADCLAALGWLVFYASVGAVVAATAVPSGGATVLFWLGYAGGWGSVFTSIGFGCLA